MACWGACDQSGSTTRPGYGRSDSSCTLKEKQHKRSVGLHSCTDLVSETCTASLTGPKVGIGADHAHDQRARDPPRQGRGLREWPSDLQRHPSDPENDMHNFPEMDPQNGFKPKPISYSYRKSVT